MTARATLALVKHLDAGDAVSYGHTWTAEAPTTVGLVPVGYGDGVPRNAGNAADVAVDGKRRPIRGRVCMDQVDGRPGRRRAGRRQRRRAVRAARRTDGAQPTAQDWAEACGTINYEIVTRIGGRMTRRYVGGTG